MERANLKRAPARGPEDRPFLDQEATLEKSGRVEELIRLYEERARQLGEEGRLIRLWTPPDQDGQWRTLGLWSARDSAGLTATLESLPLHIWMTVEATPLTPHPNDPVMGAR